MLSKKMLGKCVIIITKGIMGTAAFVSNLKECRSQVDEHQKAV